MRLISRNVGHREDVLAAAVRACEFALDIVEVKLLGGQLLPGALCGVAKVALISGIAGEAAQPLPDRAGGVPDSRKVSFAYGRYFLQRHARMRLVAAATS